MFKGHELKAREIMDLSGVWNYKLLYAPDSIPDAGKIILPGTLDEQHLSVFNAETIDSNQLRREYSFEGEVVYSKEIEVPVNWAGKEIFLNIERTKPSAVFIDGELIGSNTRISSPQNYNVTDYLSPGIHTLEISVDNGISIPPIIRNTSHANSESTQTNWNGILGKMLFEVRNPFHIEKIEVIDKNPGDIPALNIIFSSPAPDNFFLLANINKDKKIKKEIKKGVSSVLIPVETSINDYWSALNPTLREITLEIMNKKKEIVDDFSFSTGFRSFSTMGKSFIVNGYPVFLRGTVNAAVFPLTGYSPTDLKSWNEYFSILKDYGLNHVRFHSWTPPEAAFTAADNLGIYILTELPLWGEMDRDLKFQNQFLQDELMGIMEAYAQHPSFVLFSPGNELWGDISLMREYMVEARKINPRILSSYGTNVYLGLNGEMGGEDFIVSSKTSGNPKSEIRGSVSFLDSPGGGYLNTNYPNNSFNYNNALKDISVPMISHEVGQYQTYPDFSQIGKYKGILKPDNIKEFKRKAYESGLLNKNLMFSEASGKWATKLYKAELEGAMRTKGLAGIEIFGIQDYPGQGSAFIGILDSFMDSKGFIEPSEWQQSFSDLTVIAELPKYCFVSNESVEVPILKVNFTDNPDSLENIYWKTDFAEGDFSASDVSGVNPETIISLKMPPVKKPKKMELSFASVDGKILNKYDLWIYPEEIKEIKNVAVTNKLNEALSLLQEGGTVLFYTDSATVSATSLEPQFVPDFWNSRMYQKLSREMKDQESPGTLGLYINKDHPAFKNFPTDSHSDWQWYEIVSNSRPLITDRLPKEVNPIISVIDNIDRSYPLALMLECKVGKGKLMILSVDLDNIIDYPEGRWFLHSIKEYMGSKDFKPDLSLNEKQVIDLITKPTAGRRIKELQENE